jgi:enoyl-CoA hydratase
VERKTNCNIVKSIKMTTTTKYTSMLNTLPKTDYPPYATKYQFLKITINEETKVALVELNRPEKFNAMNLRMHYEIGEIWKDLDLDPRIRVVVVAGIGKSFSAGGDMEMIEAMIHDEIIRRQVHRDAKSLLFNMVNMEKIIISAVSGTAVGAGAVTALAADIIIASESATFGDGHSKLGVACGDHAAAIWPLAMGMAKAKMFLLTGDMLSAKEAENLGLVSRVVPSGDALKVAMSYAIQLANGPQHALRSTKASMNQWLRHGMLISSDYSMALEMLNFTESDVKEGMLAIQQKRRAKF